MVRREQVVELPEEVIAWIEDSKNEDAVIAALAGNMYYLLTLTEEIPEPHLTELLKLWFGWQLETRFTTAANLPVEES